MRYSAKSFWRVSRSLMLRKMLKEQKRSEFSFKSVFSWISTFRRTHQKKINSSKERFHFRVKFATAWLVSSAREFREISLPLWPLYHPPSTPTPSSVAAFPATHSSRRSRNCIRKIQEVPHHRSLPSRTHCWNVDLLRERRLADGVSAVLGIERLRRRLASIAPLRACRAYTAGALVIAPPPRIAT